MDKASGKLTVYFAEPKDYEVQEYIQKYYFSLKFSPAVETVVKDIKRNRSALNETGLHGLPVQPKITLKRRFEDKNVRRSLETSDI